MVINVFVTPTMDFDDQRRAGAREVYRRPDNDCSVAGDEWLSVVPQGGA